MTVPFTFALASGAVPASELDSDFADLEAKIQTSSTVVGVAAGTANAITATFTPTVTALVNGMTFLVRAAAANTSAAPSFKADGTTAKFLIKRNNRPLVAGDIPGAGYWMLLTYDSVLDGYVLDNPAGGSELILIGKATVANAASALVSGIPAGFSRLIVKLRGWLVFTGGTNLILRISQGGSVKSDANYVAAGTDNASNAVGTITGVGGSGLVSVTLGTNILGSSVNGLNADAEVFQPTSGGLPSVMLRATYLDASSFVHRRDIGGYYVGAAGEVDGVQILAAAGNVTGTMEVWGMLAP